MIITEPEVVATGRYSVGKTAEILGIDRKTLWRYTDEGLIRCGFHRANGRKFYLGSEIQRFWRAKF